MTVARMLIRGALPRKYSNATDSSKIAVSSVGMKMSSPIALKPEMKLQ